LDFFPSREGRGRRSSGGNSEMSNSRNKKKRKRSLLVQKRGYPFSYIIRSSTFPEMATFEESFLYPLVLLLIGAGVSGLLVARLTTRWQDHRKKLEIKVDIASKMSELIADMMSDTVLYSYREYQTIDVTEDKVWQESRKKLVIDANIIRSKLESYFSGADIKHRWEDYFSVLQSFETFSRYLFLVEKPTADKEGILKNIVKDIEIYFSDNEQINWDRVTTKSPLNQWFEITDLINKRGDEIIKDVLKLPMKVF
jgi:hypothetical protein